MKPILSAPGYFADHHGNIWRNGRQLKSQDNGNGYKRLKISQGPVCKDAYVHRLVCEAYHGACPSGLQVRHLNGVRGDNRPDNLEWSDKETNEADKRIHGTAPRGEASGLSKLTNAIVMEARRRAAAGETGKAIAASMNIPAHTIRDAITGRRWGHLPGAIPRMEKGWQRYMREVKAKRLRGQLPSQNPTPSKSCE